MNRFFLFFSFIFIIKIIIAQSPQSFKYQAVVRDVSGQVIQNQNVSLRISILEGSVSGAVVYQEEHSAITNDFGLVNLQIGNGNVISGDFTTIPWGDNSYFVQIELDETGGTSYQLMGVSQLLSVPYAMYAEEAGMTDSTLWTKNGNSIYYNIGNVGIGEITPSGKLVVKSDSTASPNDDIFCVLNANGDTVLAVYQEGVRIWVQNDTSGAKATGNRGGFAVGGFNPSKSMNDEYLRVTSDSVRIYIKDDGSKATGNRGGFAVGGFSPSKNSFTDYFFNIEDIAGTEVINPSEPRILWYPQKEAVLAGRVLIESPDSVGINSVAIGYENKAIGNWSQALGYKTKSPGFYSSALGFYTNANGMYSISVGDSTKSVGMSSLALGLKAKAIGKGSVALGTEAADQSGLSLGNVTVANGDYSFAVGMGAVTTTNAIAGVSLGLNTTSDGYACSAIGANNYCSGLFSSAIGTHNHINGDYSLALGINDTVTTSNSMAIGFNNKVTGISSFALGTNVNASGMFSAVFGVNSEATGDYSTALGHFVSTNGHTGSWIFGDFSSVVTTNSTLDNQFMVRASGGYVFYANSTLAEANAVYISPLTGNVGIGISSPTQKLTVNDVMKLIPRTSPPSGATPGDIYFDGTTQKLMVYTTFGWQACN
ncbi:MAG: hypothetical protein Kow0068_20280 [Marinilabiliales bacterium]